jgi:hypothetical protein
MADEKSNGEKVRQIVSLLPRVNCGHCGFGNCGGFALAIVEGKASPYGCEVHPLAGDEICKVLGIENPEEVKASSGYFGYSQSGISTGVGMGRGRGSGRGHHGGHHSHSSGHHRGGGRHHHLQRHFL